jgi:hypothetical protein
MRSELAGELLLQVGDLVVHAAQRGHQHAHDPAVSGLDRLRRSQLRRREPVVDGHHPGLQRSASPPTSTTDPSVPMA